jgi:hypothetical protein
MPKCEKCGYTRAVADWCTSCGSNDPYPIRKWSLRAFVVLLSAGFLLGSYLAAERVAKERFERAKSQATSFRAPGGKNR